MVLQIQEFDDLLGLFPCPEFGFAHSGGEEQVLPERGFAVRVATDQQVVQHAGVFKQLDVLEGAGNAQGRHILRCLLGELQGAVRTEVGDAAGRGGVDAADQVEHRGFARAVGADEGEDFALLHIEAHLVDRQHAAKAHAQVLGRKKGVGFHFKRSDFWKDFCRLNMPLR